MDVTHLTLYSQYLLRSNFYLNLHKVNVFICLNHTMLTLQYVSGEKKPSIEHNHNSCFSYSA